MNEKSNFNVIADTIMGLNETPHDRAIQVLKGLEVMMLAKLVDRMDLLINTINKK